MKKNKIMLAALSILSVFLFASCGGGSKDKDAIDNGGNGGSQQETTKYTVSVTNTNTTAGSVSGAGEITAGTSVTLTATPNPGYTFLGFYKGTEKVSEGNSLTYTFTAEANVTVEAKWIAQEFTLVVNANDATMGSVLYDDEATPAATYATGATVKLTAVSEEGYQFNGWYLGTQKLGDSLVYDFTMLPQNTTLTAEFGIEQCGVEVLSNITSATYPAASYTIYDASDDTQKYGLDHLFDYGTEVCVECNPNDGYTFEGWYSLDADGEKDEFLSDDLVLNIASLDDSEYKVFAEFTADTYEITLSVDPDNAPGCSALLKYDGNENPDVMTCDYATFVTLKATVGDGFSFDGWYINGEKISPLTEYDYEVLDDADIVAKFVPNEISVTFVSDDPTLGTITNESKNYDYLEEIQLEANPIEGYRLVGWYLNDETEPFSDDPDEVYVVESLTPVTIHAKFEKDFFDVAISKNIAAAGSFEVTSDVEPTESGFYYFESNVTMTASTNPGYAFIGWFYLDDVTDTENVDASKAIAVTPEYTYTVGADNVELMACWSRNEYKLTYDTNGGSDTSVGFINVKYGIKTQLEVPTRYGFAFQYWDYTDPKTGVRIALTNANGVMLEEYSILGDLSIRAKWLDGIVIASFETNGGSDIDDTEVTFNHPIERPDDPTKEGYTFAGWYDENDVQWTFSTAIVKNTTLYAHWTINQYNLTISSIDSSIVIVDDAVNGTYDFNTTIRLNAIVEEGYHFLGWFDLDTDEKVGDIADLEYVLPAKNVELEARYEANIYKVNPVLYVWYNNDPQNVVPAVMTCEKTAAYKSTVTVTISDVHEGYYLYGYQHTYGSNWIKDEQGHIINTLTFTFEMPAKDTLILAAIQHRSYTVQVSKDIEDGTAPYFNFSGDTGNYTSKSVKYTADVTLHAFDVDGYTFTGWYNVADDTKVSSDLDYTFKMKSTETLRYEARYDVNKYQLLVYTDIDDHIEETENVTELHDYDVDYKHEMPLEVEEIEGYTFLGWFDENGTQVSDKLSFNYPMPHIEKTLTAKFEINAYKLHTYYYIINTPYNLTPGNVESIDDSSTISYDYGTKITYKASTNAGWTFFGFYGVEGINNYNDDYTHYTLLSENPEFEFTVPASDYTVFPLWKANSYNIGKIASGGTIVKDMESVKFGDEFTLEIPTFEGKEFQGWKYQNLDQGISIWLTDETGYIECYDIPSNIQVVAYWGTKLQTVTFETGTDVTGDTKTFTSKVQYNGKVEQPDDPVRKGYTFLGWYTQEEGGTEWLFETALVTSDVTIYAHWEVNSYTLHFGWSSYGTYTYETDDVSGTITNANASITVEYGTTITLNYSPYIGSKLYYWCYRNNAGGTTTYTNFGQNSIEFVYNLDYDVYLYGSGTSVDEMKYFNYTSNYETCTITSVSSNYTSATSLVVPSYVTSINAGAFANCTSLTEISVPFTGTSLTATGANKMFAVIFSSTSKTGTYECKQVNYTSAFIPNTDSSSRTYYAARYVPSSLKKITITDETVIANGALSCLTSITNINLNDNITSIGSCAVFNDTAIKTTIVLPTSLERIEEYAFCGLQNVSYFYIPNENLTYIGKGIFTYDHNITSIVVPFVGDTYSKTASANQIFGYFFANNFNWSSHEYEVVQRYSSSAATVTSYIPKSLTYVEVSPKDGAEFNINAGAFMGMAYLEEVEVPCSSNHYISENLFNGCTNLYGIYGTIFDDVNSIQGSAFASCTSLNSKITIQASTAGFITIGSSAFADSAITEFDSSLVAVANIYSNAFINCESMTKFTSKSSAYVVNIQEYAFFNCSKLGSFELNLVMGVGTYAFAECTNLTSFVAKTYVRDSVGDYAFANCTSLATFTAPKFNSDTGVNSFGIGVFDGCTTITTIELPSNTKKIGEAIFAGCAALKTLTAPFIGKDNGGSTTSYTYEYSFGYWFGTTKVGDMLGKGQAKSIAINEVYDSSSNSITGNNTGTYQTTRYFPKTSMTLTLTKCANVPAYSLSNLNGNILQTLKITGISGSSYQIGVCACYYTYVSSLELCEGLTIVGTGAFYYSSLSNLSLPSTVTGIQSYAFYRNSFISSTIITLPDSCTVIGKYTFARHASLNKVILGKNISNVSEYAFVLNTSTSFTLGYNGTTAMFQNKVGGFSANWKTLTNTKGIALVTCTDGTQEV